MPIQLDADVSRERFRMAIALARSDAALPQEWLERTLKVGQSPSKTFVAMLGTALLAKATDARVDPFALKTRKHRRLQVGNSVPPSLGAIVAKSVLAQLEGKPQRQGQMRLDLYVSAQLASQ